MSPYLFVFEPRERFSSEDEPEISRPASHETDIMHAQPTFTNHLRKEKGSQSQRSFQNERRFTDGCELKNDTVIHPRFFPGISTT